MSATRGKQITSSFFVLIKYFFLLGSIFNLVRSFYFYFLFLLFFLLAFLYTIYTLLSQSTVTFNIIFFSSYHFSCLQCILFLTLVLFIVDVCIFSFLNFLGFFLIFSVCNFRFFHLSLFFLQSFVYLLFLQMFIFFRFLFTLSTSISNMHSLFFLFPFLNF